MSGGGSKGESSSSTAVDIPSFLEPFIRSSTGTAERALGGLESLLGLTGSSASVGPTMLPDVRGPDGQAVFVDPSQGAFVSASGRVLAPISEGTVPGLVNGSNNPVAVRGGDIIGIGSSGTNELFTLPPAGGSGGEALPLVAGFTPAQQAGQSLAIDRALSGDLFGDAQAAASGLATNGIDTSAISGVGLPGIGDASRDALTATANGDFLFGGDGFNAAVDAAVRRATPGILSTFGAAGAGGATGGLAQEAIGTAAVDAFASQFAQERNNQINAAGMLGNFGLQAGDQQLSQALGEVNANLGDARARLEASRLLPGLATADVDLLSRIGGAQQAQAQNELEAPRNALLQLLSAALGGTPISSLLGQTTDADQRGLFLGFEA